jgi:hypothetical protein
VNHVSIFARHFLVNRDPRYAAAYEASADCPAL